MLVKIQNLGYPIIGYNGHQRQRFEQGKGKCGSQTKRSKLMFYLLMKGYNRCERRGDSGEAASALSLLGFEDGFYSIQEHGIWILLKSVVNSLLQVTTVICWRAVHWKDSVLTRGCWLKGLWPFMHGTRLFILVEQKVQ